MTETATLVLGGKGKTGRRVAERLVRAGKNVRISSTPIPFDWERPATLAAEPFVDVDDIAEIAAAALTSNAHSRRLYEVTGTKAITFPEAIHQIAQASGRTIARRFSDYVQQTAATGVRGGSHVRA